VTDNKAGIMTRRKDDTGLQHTPAQTSTAIDRRRVIAGGLGEATGEPLRPREDVGTFGHDVHAAVPFMLGPKHQREASRA